MYNLYSVNDINILLKKHNFTFSKGLGQNFISSCHICPKMVKLSGISKSSGVIEIGPGIGTLTREIASCAQKITAIEIDDRLLPILSETTSEYDNVKIIKGDILKLNINKLILDEFKECLDIRVCANLPYYITSPVIMKLLEGDFRISSITVMVQKEAAQRICALPGSSNCGSLSVAVRYYADPKILFNVPKGCFIPLPKIDSSVIKVDINHNNSNRIHNKSIFFKVIRAAFAQRRKTILNSLSSGLDLDKDLIFDILNELGISFLSRAEHLSFDQFVYISNCISK